MCQGALEGSYCSIFGISADVYSSLLIVTYVAPDKFKSQSIAGLVTDGQKHPTGSAGSELQGYGHIQTNSVRGD